MRDASLAVPTVITIAKCIIPIEIKTFGLGSRIGDMVLWDEQSFELRCALYDLRGQRYSCPCYNTNNFEQIR